MRLLISSVVVLLMLTGQPCEAAEPIFKNIFKPQAGTAKTMPKAIKAKGLLRNLVIETLTVEARDGRWVWVADVKSQGRRFRKNQLQITATQLEGVVNLGPAGEMIRNADAIDKNATRRFTRQDWPKSSRATHLRVEVLDTRARKKVQKTIGFPKPQNATATGSSAASQVVQMGPGALADVEQIFAVESAVYKGRGDFEVRIRNTGNVVISAGQIEVQPIYRVTKRPPLMGAVVSNRGAIPIKNIRPIKGWGKDGLYWNNIAECCIFRNLELLVRNKQTGQQVTHTLEIPFPRYEFVGIDLYNSEMTFKLRNDAPYKAAYNVRLSKMSIYSKDHDGHSTKKRCTLKDALHGRVTLAANEYGSITFGHKRVNAEIRRQCPKMKNGFYNAEGLFAEMWTEEADPFCKIKGYGCPYGQISVNGFYQVGDPIFYQK